MQKTYTKEEVDQFYVDYKRAGIRKPVATLARLTGLSTGNVSEYLHRKKEASDKLITAFYQHYGSSIKNLQDDRKELDLITEVTKLMNWKTQTEITIHVLKQTIAGVVEASNGKSAALVLAQLDEAIELGLKNKREQT